MASWFSPLKRVLELKNNKTFLIISSGIVIGYSIYSFYTYRHHSRALIDEGFEETVKLLEEIQVKRILVLGLDGSGKSSFLSQLSKKSSQRTSFNQGVIDQSSISKPTEGFNVVSVSSGNGISLNLWEIGGSKKCRTYWSNFLQDTDVLIFMVDSSDFVRLPEAVKELHILSADDRLNNVPIVILANKQDMSNAHSPKAIAEIFSVGDLESKGHKVQVIGLEVPPTDKPHATVNKTKLIISKLVSKKAH